MRHMEVKQLWLQECVKQGTIQLIKIVGKLNPADLMTKFHDLSGLLTVSEFLCLRLVVDATSDPGSGSQGAC